jgi:hypothetical protein
MRDGTMNNTRAIDVLLEIMADNDLVTRLRIEAAEALLGFEAPAEAVARAREFLVRVFENKEESIGDRMDALQASRKAEAAKITPRTMHLTHREEADRKEAWRKYEILQLKMRIVLATHDHPPPGWDADLRSPDYLPPPGSEWPPTIRLVADNRDKERG